MKLSELYGMDIFTDKARYLGKVEDVILNLDGGEVMRLTLEPLREGVLSKDRVGSILRTKSIKYSDVSEIGDVIMSRVEPKPEKRHKLKT